MKLLILLMESHKIGRWNFDDLYFTKIEENNNKIILKS